MHHQTTHRSTPAKRTGPKKSWALLAVALAAQILVVLDISVVNTALPSIGSALHLDGSQLQWLVTAYLMMSGGGLLLGGRISDLLSRRRVFLTGLSLFTVASLVSGFADTGSQLIAARAVQGLSAALLTPSALSLIMTTYAGTQRKTALAMWGAVGSLGVAAGVLLGGALTTWASWQAIFWINVPIGVVALLVGRHIIAKDTAARPSVRDFDFPGAADRRRRAGHPHLRGQRHRDPRLVVGPDRDCTAVSAALLVTFLKLEQRAAKPLFPPHVWKLQALVSGTTVMLGVTGILVGTVFLTSIFAPDGARLLRPGDRARVPAVRARHHRRHPGRQAHAGPPLTAGHRDHRAADHRRRLGVALHRRRGAHFATDILPGLSVLGLGVGMVFVPVSVTSMAGIPASHAGVASGFLMTGHEIGAALGVAVLSAVASTAGSLATATGAADAFSAGFIGAAVMGAVVRGLRASPDARHARRPAAAATCTCTDTSPDPAHTAPTEERPRCAHAQPPGRRPGHAPSLPPTPSRRGTRLRRSMGRCSATCSPATRDYLLMGIPLTVAFQMLVRRRPLRELWVRDAARLPLARGTVAGHRAPGPRAGLLGVRALEDGNLVVIGWYAAAVLGAAAAAFALRSTSYVAMLRSAALPTAVGVVGNVIVIGGIQVGHGHLHRPAGVGRQRGQVDRHLLPRNVRDRGGRLPRSPGRTRPPPGRGPRLAVRPVRQRALGPLAPPVAEGCLSHSWSRLTRGRHCLHRHPALVGLATQRNLAGPAFAHSAIDAVRNGLLLGL